MPLPPPVSVRLTTLPSHDCNYIPGRVATTRAFRIDQMPAGMYRQFMDAGFRRSGMVVYQPICGACQSCVPIRVPVAEFLPTKSQRRCVRANLDLMVTESAPELTDEKLDLYQRYQAGWHHKPADDRAAVEAFLYHSPVPTLEFCYRDPGGTLLGVGIADVCDRCFSSVYFYFDPQQSRRGLGTLGAMHEIDWCRRSGLEYYYLGYWISECPAMKYKSNFRPAEILGADGIWRRLP